MDENEREFLKRKAVEFADLCKKQVDEHEAFCKKRVNEVESMLMLADKDRVHLIRRNNSLVNWVITLLIMFTVSIAYASIKCH